MPDSERARPADTAAAAHDKQTARPRTGRPVSPEEQALASALQILSHLGIPHMLTGWMATSFHGHPRATHDADIVIDPTPEQVDGLIRAFEDAGFYVRRSGDSERQLRDAAGVVELNPQIDRSYIASWAEQLGVSDLWDAISHPGA
jgi:hypothetical protein